MNRAPYPIGKILSASLGVQQRLIKAAVKGTMCILNLYLAGVTLKAKRNMKQENNKVKK